MDTIETRKSTLLITNKPKKILLVTEFYQPDIGSLATYSRFLKEELPKHTKDKIRIITLTWGELKSWPNFLRWPVVFFKALNRGRFCDVVYSLDSLFLGLVCSWVASLLRKPFWLKIDGDQLWLDLYCHKIFLSNPIAFITEPLSGWTGWKRRVQIKVLNSAKVIVVPNKKIEKLVLLWGVAKERVILIPNSFEPPQSIESKETIRKKWQVTGKIIIAGGRLESDKRLDSLIGTMPEVLNHFPEAKLMIIGIGSEEARLKTLVSELNLEDSVVLTGKLEQETLYIYLRLADLFIDPSIYLGSEQLLLEASMLGTKSLILDGDNLSANNIIKVLAGSELKTNTFSPFLVPRGNKENVIELARLIPRG